MDTFKQMQDAIYASVANTPCDDPMDAVMALCCVMCDILVQIKMDDNQQVCGAVMKSLEMAREAYNSQEIH
jgi:energy-converting hydrogenase A subunit M